MALTFHTETWLIFADGDIISIRFPGSGSQQPVSCNQKHKSSFLPSCFPVLLSSCIHLCPCLLPCLYIFLPSSISICHLVSLPHSVLISLSLFLPAYILSA